MVIHKADKGSIFLTGAPCGNLSLISFATRPPLLSSLNSIFTVSLIAKVPPFASSSVCSVTV
jgi:hypothetical protein